MNGFAVWMRGYVYLGSQLLAVQDSGVYWMHEDPVTKSKRVTNSAGTVVSTIELDPWGADTNRSNNGAFQPKKFTSYDRDANGADEAMFRRYNRWQSRFDQPDPYDGSYDSTDPQSFNRYAYVQGDPVNFVDPSGLCAFNIGITGLGNISNETLIAAQNEISRIFGQAGQSVNFSPATAGTTYHMNLANIGASVLPGALGSTRQNTDGSISNYGAAYLNRIGSSLANEQNPGLRLLGMNQTNIGTALGRVVAHEDGHYLLQLTNAQHTSSGLMRAQFPGSADLFRTGGFFDTAFQFSARQRLALNKLCEPVTTDRTLPNTSPIVRPPIGRGGGGRDIRPIFGGGGGFSGWTSFDFLYLMFHLGEHVTVTVKPL